MNDEFSLCEEEGVRLDLPGRVDDFLLFLAAQAGHVVDDLPVDCAVGVHVAKFGRELVEDASTEIVPLHHLEAFNRLRSVL